MVPVPQLEGIIMRSIARAAGMPLSLAAGLLCAGCAKRSMQPRLGWVTCMNIKVGQGADGGGRASHN